MFRLTFEELHRDGAHEFGGAWIVMNETVVHTAIRYGLDVQAHKTALSAIALAILRDARADAKASPAPEGTDADI